MTCVQVYYYIYSFDANPCFAVRVPPSPSLQLHHGPLAASRRTAPLLLALRDAARLEVTRERDACGTNLAGLKILKRRLDAAKLAITADQDFAAKEVAKASLSER